MNFPNIDILSPIDTLIGTVQHGKMHRFTIDTTPTHNAYQVEKLLRSYGVRVWGRKIVGSKRSFLVKQSQAQWAEYVLCRAGIPIAGPLLDERNAGYPDHHPEDSMPTPWTENGISASSFIDHLGDWLSKIGA